jgi:hypothetical protein
MDLLTYAMAKKGGGGGTLRVNFTIDFEEDPITVTADKTPEEIFAAVNAGQSVEGYDGYGFYGCTAANEDEEVLDFWTEDGYHIWLYDEEWYYEETKNIEYFGFDYQDGEIETDYTYEDIANAIQNEKVIAAKIDGVTDGVLTLTEYENINVMGREFVSFYGSYKTNLSTDVWHVKLTITPDGATLTQTLI